jgi:ribosomal protein S18 acetylase RimI-like enzyme
VATVDDCDAIAAMEHEQDGVEPAVSLERCRRHVTDPEVCLLVATVGDEVVGFGRAARFEPPADAGRDAAPAGWYLFGVIVRDTWRRRGIASRLTEARLDWIAERATEAWYFTNAANQPSIDLHARIGFVEVSRTFAFPKASFEGGTGVLCRMALPRVLRPTGPTTRAERPSTRS